MTQAFRQYLEKQAMLAARSTHLGVPHQTPQKTVTFCDDFEVLDDAPLDQRLSAIPEAHEVCQGPHRETYTSCGGLDEERLRGNEACDLPPPPAEWYVRRATEDDVTDEFEQGISLRGFLGSRETALLNDAAACSSARAAPQHLAQSPQGPPPPLNLDTSPTTARKHSCVCGVDALFSRAPRPTPPVRSKIPPQPPARRMPSCLSAQPASYADLHRLAQQQGLHLSSMSPNANFATRGPPPVPRAPGYLDVDAGHPALRGSPSPQGVRTLHPLQVSVAQAQACGFQRLDSFGSAESGVPSPLSISSAGSGKASLTINDTRVSAAVTWRNADQGNVTQAQEVRRKREYRVGLNLFNRKPVKGLQFLIERHFVERSPNGVADFLLNRKGLSKQVIGEFLGDLQNPFAMHTLRAFTTMIDFSHLTLDAALRKFLRHFRLPGEAQKIEQILDVFAKQYCLCNPDLIYELFNSSDTLFLLIYATIMLNTDLHNPNVKQERKMKLEDFVKNLKGVDEGCDVKQNVLVGIYNRIKAESIKPGVDHVTQVEALEVCLAGPHLALPEAHRRLVCYCQMQYLVFNSPVTTSCVSPLSSSSNKLKKEEVDLFLFNDLLLVAKRKDKRKQRSAYVYLQSLKLNGMKFQLISMPFAEFGFSLFYNDEEAAVFFNAKSDSDRSQFARDLHECILEVVETDQILKLDSRQSRHSHDSGIMDLTPSSSSSSNSSASCRVAMMDLPHHPHHNQLSVTPNSTGDACSEESLDSGIHNR